MSLYFVRWYVPGRAKPLRKDFPTKSAANTFRDGLPYLSEPPERYKDEPEARRAAYAHKPGPQRARSAAYRARMRA